MQTAEEFAQTVIQACEDDHLLSREALPVFIAEEIRADRAAAKLEVLEEMLALGADASIATIDRLRAKYAKAGGGA